MLERVTMLREPPVVGRFYLVPTVVYPWLGRKDIWPVFLPRHEDAEHLNFPWLHYHVDPRFLTERQREYADVESDYSRHPDGVALLQAMPLNEKELEPPARKPSWRRRRCSARFIPYHHHHEDVIHRLQTTFAGRQCRRTNTGLLCPHKRFPLGSLVTVDGVVTCPLHGLRIDVESGHVLPAEIAA